MQKTTALLLVAFLLLAQPSISVQAQVPIVPSQTQTPVVPIQETQVVEPQTWAPVVPAQTQQEKQSADDKEDEIPVIQKEWTDDELVNEAPIYRTNDREDYEETLSLEREEEDERRREEEEYEKWREERDREEENDGSVELTIKDAEKIFKSLSVEEKHSGKIEAIEKIVQKIVDKTHARESKDVVIVYNEPKDIIRQIEEMLSEEILENIERVIFEWQTKTIGRGHIEIGRDAFILTKYYRNGKKMSEKHYGYLDQVPCPWREWYEDGQISNEMLCFPKKIQKVYFKNGELQIKRTLIEGKFKEEWWYENGQIKERFDGELREEWWRSRPITTRVERNLKLERWYKDGQLARKTENGVTKRWYQNGQLMSVGEEVENEVTQWFEKPKYTEWYENGSIHIIKNGGITKSWYPNGEKKVDKVSDEKKSRYESWWENGNKKEESIEKIAPDGRWHDNLKWWWENGNLRTSEFRIDNETSRIKEWRQDGTPKYEADWEKGFTKIWYEKGQKSSETQFLAIKKPSGILDKENLKIIMAMYWYKNGKKLAEFKDGKLQVWNMLGIIMNGLQAKRRFCEKDAHWVERYGYYECDGWGGPDNLSCEQINGKVIGYHNGCRCRGEDCLGKTCQAAVVYSCQVQKIEQPKKILMIHKLRNTNPLTTSLPTTF